METKYVLLIPKIRMEAISTEIETKIMNERMRENGEIGAEREREERERERLKENGERERESEKLCLMLMCDLSLKTMYIILLSHKTLLRFITYFTSCKLFGLPRILQFAIQ